MILKGLDKFVDYTSKVNHIGFCLLLLEDGYHNGSSHGSCSEMLWKENQFLFVK